MNISSIDIKFPDPIKLGEKYKLTIDGLKLHEEKKPIRISKISVSRVLLNPDGKYQASVN